MAEDSPPPSENQSFASTYILLEDKLAEDGQSAVVEGIGHDPPLIVVQRTSSRIHPQLHHSPAQLLAQCSHLEEQ